jgi:hypothetical protein
MGKGGNGSRVSQPVTEWYKNRHLIMWIWGIFAIVGFLAGIAIGLNSLE